MIYIWILEIPEEDVCKVEVGELGKIVELGRENAKEVDEEADRRNPPPPTHFGFLYRNSQINWPTLKDIGLVHLAKYCLLDKILIMIQ